jgi:hypothetical protein
MKGMKLLIIAVFAPSVFISANPIGTVLVTSLPGGTVIPMPNNPYFGMAPRMFGPGITGSSTKDSVVRGGAGLSVRLFRILRFWRDQS